ncbi:NAD(P)-dependent methylenetetrahydromethanopterin dehydrogenase [Methylotenera versatilis]|uniref:NAD(P)-dependent methylenetetrahydromethanopterin dehydrogenase n=1 Tax=Methylotenera versatilis TaxID=1055487 RepID=UPI0006478155|nr:NAD(P)-dependent methylenetetrahydromethanopterin dehydrogenase [Methylotenera versatilis]
MQKVSILHLITAAKNASPFDVNMAYDAGFDKIMPYTNVVLNEVAGLTQDAIFSRSPSGVKREALFIGGRDIHLALTMQQATKNAMFTPFEMSTFADPSGAFTTAAAMLAKVDTVLKNNQQELAAQTIAILGAGGAVGSTVALIAASLGATVQLVAHKELAQMQAYAAELESKYGLALQVVDGTDDVKKTQIVQTATVAICAAAAGIRVLELAHFITSKTLKIVADVNAVAPSGAAGVDVMSDGQLIADTQIFGLGALAIGQLKYKTQQAMLQQMLETEHPVHLAYNHAFDIARAF